MKTKNEIVAIETPEVLSKYLKPLYIIEDYTHSEESYKAFQERIYNIIKGCFEHKDCREYPVKFSFYRKDTKVYKLQLRHFIVNVFIWYPFVNTHEFSNVLDETYIIDCFNDIPNITQFINKKLISTLREFSIRNTIINRSISEVLYNLRRISTDFSIILNLTISTETFLDIYESNPRMREIMETKFPLDMQPYEIEQELASLQSEEVEILKGMKNNPLGVILRAGTGIKHKQLVEFTINQGLKPNLDGVTIPIPINSSTLIRGLEKPSYLYIDALGARKSLIMNKVVMGDAGYFGKLLLLLARTLSLSKTVSDCGTKHYLPIEIKNEKILKKYNGRYYKLHEKESLKLLNVEKDKHLIGQIVLFRGPITCICPNQDEVCHKCFGITSLINLDIADGVAGFETEEVTKVINQMILSTKHLLTTISEKIEFTPQDKFDKFFYIYAGEISPRISHNNNEDLDNWSIWINPSHLQKADELDDDSSFNTFIPGSFYLQNTQTGELIEINSKDKRKLFLTDECLELMKKNRGYIKFKDMSDDITLFQLVIINNELTKPLYSLMDLLEKERKPKKGEEKMTYSQMAQTFTELLVESGIDAMALAGELIINRLIRKLPDDDYERPDFSTDEVPPYQIYTVLKALKRNKSAYIGLASEDIKAQFLNDDFFTTKVGRSFIDVYYSKKTSTERLKEIAKRIQEA